MDQTSKIRTTTDRTSTARTSTVRINTGRTIMDQTSRIRIITGQTSISRTPTQRRNIIPNILRINKIKITTDPPNTGQIIMILVLNVGNVFRRTRTNIVSKLARL